jgi:hypothetical protein
MIRTESDFLFLIFLQEKTPQICQLKGKTGNNKEYSLSTNAQIVSTKVISILTAKKIIR